MEVSLCLLETRNALKSRRNLRWYCPPLFIVQENEYLVGVHENGVLQTQARFENSMTFRPSSMQSITHQRIARSVKSQVKGGGRKTKHYVPEMHPELELQAVEKEENDKQKARRRLESKRRSVKDKYGRGLTEDGLEYDSDEDLGHGYGRGREYQRDEGGDEGGEEEDDLGDFVVDDEDDGPGGAMDIDDEDERDERVRNAKRPRENDMSDEEEVVLKKAGKKRVIESDSDSG
jgi:RNA polymerase-associated protein LEO1